MLDKEVKVPGLLPDQVQLYDPFFNSPQISSFPQSIPVACQSMNAPLFDYSNCQALSLETSKRKYFTKVDDHLLIMAVHKYKHESWNIIAQHVPGKTPKQCRDRWANYLNPSLELGPWSQSEDQLLVSLVNKYGTHWTKMKNEFPHRSTNSLKNRWYWLIKNQVKTYPLEKPKNKLINSHDNTKNMEDQNDQGSSVKKSELINHTVINNDLNDHNNNNNYNFSFFDDYQQKCENQYYFLPKKINNKKKGSTKLRKGKFCNLENENMNDIDDIFNFNINFDFQEECYQFNVNDLITFNQDELDW
ncbi:hypothetical protein M9Y10_031072 [Tritrichomonas musculus]|uniref:Myb-like DNA-binding domain containing protein n=1 Tax=Tritrichomonas musculus TaxID=1915356 RepID=A0ABR2H1Q1_9EUKA